MTDLLCYFEVDNRINDTLKTYQRFPSSTGDDMKIPKYRKNGDGRGFAVYPKSGGKREYFGQYGSQEAEARYREWLTRLLNSEETLFNEKKQGTYYVVELVKKYLDHIGKRDSPEQYTLSKNALKRLVRLCGTELAINIGPSTLIQYQNMMSKEEQGYKRSTINRHVNCVRRFVKWCCKFEYLPPEHHLKLTAVDNLRKGENGVKDGKPISPVSFETVKRTLPFMHTIIQDMAQVQYYCGMRPNEVCCLNWDEIDQTDEIWLYVPYDHKTRHRQWELMKAIPPVAQRILKRDERYSEGTWIFDPRIVGTNPNTGEKYNRKSYSRAIKSACERAIAKGVIDKAWTPNQLRHAIATDIRRLYSRDKAQSYLGHSSIDTTGIYADRTRGEVIEIAKALERDLFNNQ